MKFVISETQNNKLKEHIQYLIDSELDNIKNDSDDWGMGEMDALMEIGSIDKIVIDRIVPHMGTVVYIDIIRKPNMDFRYEYDNTRSEIQYRIEDWIPNIKIFINDIK
jgi:hypothetical protein